jgi:hypothetical protein
LQLAPVKAVVHEHEPSVCAVPCPLQVVASEYWHVAPADPALQLQVPVAGAQVPELEHVCGVPELHAPAEHVSVAVHALPSLQLAPLVREPHVPFAAAPAAMLQAWQSVVLPAPQAVLQQRASTQNVEVQSALRVHAAPLARPTPQ